MPAHFPSTASKSMPSSLSETSMVFEIFVPKSDGFSVPKTLWAITLPSRTSFCSHRSLISKCYIFPRPCLPTKLLAALLAVPICTIFSKSITDFYCQITQSFGPDNRFNHSIKLSFCATQRVGSLGGTPRPNTMCPNRPNTPWSRFSRTSSSSPITISTNMRIILTKLPFALPYYLLPVH